MFINKHNNWRQTFSVVISYYVNDHFKMNWHFCSEKLSLNSVYRPMAKITLQKYLPPFSPSRKQTVNLAQTKTTLPSCMRKNSHCNHLGWNPILTYSKGRKKKQTSHIHTQKMWKVRLHFSAHARRFLNSSLYFTMSMSTPKFSRMFSIRHYYYSLTLNILGGQK